MWDVLSLLLAQNSKFACERNFSRRFSDDFSPFHLFLPSLTSSRETAASERIGNCEFVKGELCITNDRLFKVDDNRRGIEWNRNSNYEAIDLRCCGKFFPSLLVLRRFGFHLAYLIDRSTFDERINNESRSCASWQERQTGTPCKSVESVSLNFFSLSFCRRWSFAVPETHIVMAFRTKCFRQIRIL